MENGENDSKPVKPSNKKEAKSSRGASKAEKKPNFVPEKRNLRSKRNNV